MNFLSCDTCGDDHSIATVVPTIKWLQWCTCVSCGKKLLTLPVIDKLSVTRLIKKFHMSSELPGKLGNRYKRCIKIASRLEAELDRASRDEFYDAIQFTDENSEVLLVQSYWKETIGNLSILYIKKWESFERKTPKVFSIKITVVRTGIELVTLLPVAVSAAGWLELDSEDLIRHNLNSYPGFKWMTATINTGIRKQPTQLIQLVNSLREYMYLSEVDKI